MFNHLIIKTKESVFFLAVIIILTLGLCYQITEPWVGIFDFNGAAYSRFAKNFLTFGFIKTKMTPTWNMGSIIPQHFDYYVHHPPVIAYLVAGSFKIFGIHEWSARIVPIIFSIMALILFYLIVRLLWGKVVALLSLVFLGFTPMFLYYGRMVNHEAVFLFFYFFTVFFYLKYLIKRKKIYLVTIIISFILSYLTAWSAFFLSIALAIHYLIFAYKITKDKRPIFIFVLMPILFTLLYSCWIYAIKGSLSENIKSIISRLGPNASNQFTWMDFFVLEFNRIKFLFTTVLCILTFWGIVFLLLQISRKQFFNESIIAFFFLLPLMNIFLFREGAWEHDYQLYYFLPFFAIVSARGMLAIRDYLHRKTISKVFILAFIMLFFVQSYRNFFSIHTFKFDIDREIAIKINLLSKPDNEIGTTFEVSVPTSWYLDRKYTVIRSLEEFKEINAVKKLSLIVVFPHRGNRDLVKFLSSAYTYFAFKNFLFFKL